MKVLQQEPANTANPPDLPPSNGAPPVILVGNPNVGKSVLFSLMTGAYVVVSNYPGTTVEVTRGTGSQLPHAADVLDTPGVNTLLPMSEDEKVTRDILLNTRDKVVVQVADAKNLRRALVVTTQLAEMGIPMILCLNMQDEARNRGITIDEQRLSELLGVPVVSTIAPLKVGLSRLVKLLGEPRPSKLQVRYPGEVERAVQGIALLLPETGMDRRALALMLLSEDQTLQVWLQEHVIQEVRDRIAEICRLTAQRLGQSMGAMLNVHRIAAVDKIMEQVYQKQQPVNGSHLRGMLEMISGHPVYGLGMLGLVMWFMYWFVGVVGADYAVGFLENTVFGEYLNPWVTAVFDWAIPWRLARDFIVGEYGLFTMAVTYSVAIIFPIVTTFFLSFSVLEDTGYLPRLAMMLNRTFRLIGLNGKAVLPMVLGLGCDTMATMTTRILSTRKERMIVMFLLSLAVPCSAQIGVIGGMLAKLSGWATVLWLGVVIGVLLGIGKLAAMVIPGEGSDFIMELPPFRKPRISNIVIKTVARVEWYIKEVAPLFIIATAALFVLNETGGLLWLRDISAPVIQHFLGLPAAAADAFLIGFFRRDYGAAGLYALTLDGRLDSVQMVVSIITITLFVPCVAHVLMMFKEAGKKATLLTLAFVFPFAFLVGGVVNQVLRYFQITF